MIFIFLCPSGIIRAEAFASQPTLERIDLRHNRISIVESGAFAGISAPKDIYLAGNRINQLNSDVFEVRNHSLISSLLEQ